MEEQEQLRIGSYCTNLLADAQFNELAQIVELSLSQDMLTADTAEEREKIHSTYKGFKYLLDTMQQFVVCKDQIVANQESDNN